MPQLGETVAEGTIAVWHKQAGDRVKADEILIDVETDKVATEIPAPADGILAEILVAEGETVEVGTRLAVLLTDDDETAPSPPALQQAAPPPPEHRDEPAPSPEKAAPGRTAFSDDSGPLSPAVRRLLAEHGLEPADIKGTGRQGRIKRSDVLEFLAAGNSRPSAVQESGYIPFNRLRRVTAEHMVHSKATSPHVLQAVEVDFNNVARVREVNAAAWKTKQGFSLTYLPFIARAVCMALEEFPRINASVEGDGLRLHEQVNLAIAVDLGHDGLLAPVIRAAGGLSVSELARQIHAMADKARQGKIGNDDLARGTYTISNSGSFGTLITAPIINQPQVAILSTDGIRKRPVVISGPQGDMIAIHPVGILAQSFDHRAIDGAYSAAYLKRVQAILEEADWSAQL